MVLLLAGCAAPPKAKPVEPDPEVQVLAPSGLEIWAYHAHWMGEAWRAYDLRALRRLLFFDLVVGNDGRIESRNGWPEQWEDLRKGARDARVPLDPVVTVLSAEMFSAIFASDEARARLVGEIVSLARDSGGVHIDVEVFESVGAAELNGFRSFLEVLRTALDVPPRKILTAFVPASGGLYGAKELALLDAVVAQGYDVHWRTGPNAGPVAILEGESPAAWRSAAETLVGQGVPARKIVFSTPLYGYEWPTVSGEPRAASRGPAAIITYASVASSLLPELGVNALARVREHGLLREPATGTPWYAFKDADGWRQGWFDDPVSLGPRLAFVKHGNYRGVALFVLGYDGGALLDAIQASFKAGSEGADGARRPASP